MPMVNHVLMMGAGIIYGFYSQTPALALIAVVMLVMGLLVHLVPWWTARRQNSQQPQPAPGD